KGVTSPVRARCHPPHASLSSLPLTEIREQRDEGSPGRHGDQLGDALPGGNLELSRPLPPPLGLGSLLRQGLGIRFTPPRFAPLLEGETQGARQGINILVVGKLPHTKSRPFGDGESDLAK